MAVEYTPSGQYVDGEWRDPAGSGSIPVTNPTTEETLADVTSTTEAEVEAAIRRGRPLRVGQAARAGARPAGPRGRRRPAGTPRGTRRVGRRRTGQTRRRRPRRDRRRGGYGSVHGRVGPPHRGGHPPWRVPRGVDPLTAPARRRRRRHRPLELPRGGVHAEARSGARGREHRRRQTQRGDPAVDAAAGRTDRGTRRPAAGGVQPRDRRRVGRRVTRRVAHRGHGLDDRQRRDGQQIKADAAANLTKVSLELGGKPPAIVWKDADVDRAVEDILTARMTNTGQVCTCAEQVYVHSDVRVEFEEQYVAAAEDVEFGDPFEDPDMEPQVSAAGLDKTERAVENTRESGAQVLTGSDRPTGDEYDRGYWYEPTVVTSVEQDHEIIQREVSGPVTPIVEIDSLDQANKYANDSRYGLPSYVYTDDYRTAMRAAEDLEFGETDINRTLREAWHGHHIGWNGSGLGGEDGKYGFQKYTQIKTVYHDYS